MDAPTIKSEGLIFPKHPSWHQKRLLHSCKQPFILWYLFNIVRAWKNLMYLWWRCNISPPSSPSRHPIFQKNTQNSPSFRENPLKNDHKWHQNRDKIPLRSSNRWRNRWVVFRHFCPKPITNFLVIDYYSLIFEQNQSPLLEKSEISRCYTSVPCRRVAICDTPFRLSILPYTPIIWVPPSKRTPAAG